MIGPNNRILPAFEGEQRIALLLVFAFVPLFSFFFQGGGWAQNSRFDTIRAIVESGRLEITDLATNTGDIGVVEGRVYSNKPVGMAVIASPVYWMLIRAESNLGFKPHQPYLVSFNAHLLTVVLSGIPAAGLIGLLYLHFRRRGSSRFYAKVLASAFGIGTLVLPYSGVMLSHNLVAFALFGAWLLISSRHQSQVKIVSASVLLGLALCSNYLAGPLTILYGIELHRRRRSFRLLAILLVVPIFAVSALCIQHLVSFGSILTTSYHIQDPMFRESDLFWGVFDIPQPVRMYWLSIHPYRGLFYVCPLLSIAASPFFRPAQWRGKTLEQTLFALGIVMYFLAFNLSFNGWTGGWGIGPRYLTPMLPFLYIHADVALRQFPISMSILGLLSAANMIAVTAVQALLPAENFGPALAFNPLAYALNRLFAGEVSVSINSMLEFGQLPSLQPGILDSWDSYNLGEVLGFTGVGSLTPFLAWITLLAIHYWHSRCDQEKSFVAQETT